VGGRTFLRELFLGNFLLDHIHPFPAIREQRPEFKKFYGELRRFLRRSAASSWRPTGRG
jgi:hypothetical protein